MSGRNTTEKECRSRTPSRLVHFTQGKASRQRRLTATSTAFSSIFPASPLYQASQLEPHSKSVPLCTAAAEADSASGCVYDHSLCKIGNSSQSERTILSNPTPSRKICISSGRYRRRSPQNRSCRHTSPPSLSFFHQSLKRRKISFIQIHGA